MSQCERTYGSSGDRCKGESEFTWHWGDQMPDEQYAGKTSPVCEECASLLYACDYGVTRDGWSDGDIHMHLESVAPKYGITRKRSA